MRFLGGYQPKCNKKMNVPSSGSKVKLKYIDAEYVKVVEKNRKRLLENNNALQKENEQLKAEIERLHKLQKPTETSGYKIENGKVVFYTNMLNGYRHEYANLDEVVKDLNLMLQNAYASDEVIGHHKGKLQTAKSEAIKEFAERLKKGMCFDRDYNDLITTEKYIKKVAKEMVGDDNA